MAYTPRKDKFDRQYYKYLPEGGTTKTEVLPAVPQKSYLKIVNAITQRTY